MNNDYKIVSEDLNSIRVLIGPIEYIVNKLSKRVVYMTNTSQDPAEVCIPNVLPTGHEIDVLSHRFAMGNFSKIIVSDGITIDDEAFLMARVKEVVWPSSCKVIPRSCFKVSSLEKITNTEKIEKICRDAFAFSKLDQIDLSNVSVIEEYAFADCKIKKAVWSNNCKKIPSYCFYRSCLSQIDGLENIDYIGRGAFSASKLRVLDLSQLDGIYLEEGSLARLPKWCEVTTPYYLPDEIRENAFVNVD